MATIDDLQAAFNGESNARVKYLAYAKKADEEDYGKVASLIRAAAAAEEVHARNHERVIKRMGGNAQATIAPVDVKSTRDNLAAAIQGEVYERDVMYPGFIKAAAGNRDATHTFQDALAGEKEHARLYQQALSNLEQRRGGKQDFWVCPVCGYTTEVAPGADCPVCGAKKEKFKLVN